MSISLAELKDRFPRHEITATLQCAGNRRDELDRVRPFVNEVMWSGDAIGTAVWTGAPLADVIRATEPDPRATHVWFQGLDQARIVRRLDTVWRLDRAGPSRCSGRPACLRDER